MENVEVELDGQRSPEAQAIIDAELGVEPEIKEEEETNDGLPSDEEEEGGEPQLFAGKYKSEDELVKGIKNIGSNLPEYVIDGMSIEALEKHYTELDKSFNSQDRTSRKHADKPVKEEALPEESEAKPEAVGQELWNELEAQYTANGNITAEQYDKLNKAGVPDAIIDKYLDSVKDTAQAQLQSFTDKVLAETGGRENLDTIKAWAEDGGIPAEELKMISDTKDYGQLLIMMKGVKARYEMSGGTSTQGQPIRGGRTASSSKGYSSEASYLADVTDPRYSSDNAFREKVKAKLSRSNLTS